MQSFRVRVSGGAEETCSTDCMALPPQSAEVCLRAVQLSLSGGKFITPLWHFIMVHVRLIVVM